MSQFGFGAGADPEFGGPQPANGPQPAPDAPLTGAEFSLDFTNAQDVPEFQVLPQGEYTFMVDSAEPDRSKNTGAAMVILTLKVWEGPLEGRTMRHWLVMPNKAKQEPEKYQQSIDFLCATLEAITGETWKGTQRTLVPERDLANRICRAYVTIKPDRNDPNIKRNNIARFIRKDAAPTSSGAPTGFGGFGS